MDIKKTLDFLTELEANNNREWFQNNKKTYDTLKDAMLKFLSGLIPEIARFDPEILAVAPGDCIFRIYRDVRFSHDKLPYKTHIGAFISKTGRKGNSPGYYIHIEPGQSFLAGGFYMPPPELLKAVRDEIYFNAGEFKAIISQPEFIDHFGKLDDFDKLTRPPKGFAADWPDIDLLKYRSYVVTHKLTDERLLSAGFADHGIKVFKALFPLNNFLQKARNNSE